MQLNRSANGWTLKTDQQQEMLRHILLLAQHMIEICQDRNPDHHMAQGELFGENWHGVVEADAKLLLNIAEREAMAESGWLLITGNHRRLLADALLAFQLWVDKRKGDPDWTRYNDGLYPETIREEIKKLRAGIEKLKSEYETSKKPRQVWLDLPTSVSPSAVNTIIWLCRTGNHTATVPRDSKSMSIMLRE